MTRVLHDTISLLTSLDKLRWENGPANRPASRETGLKMPCCPASDLLWSKSLKVILIDSDFRAYTVLGPLVSLTSSSRKDFLEGKNFFSPESISRASRAPKMGDGGVFCTPCADFSRPVEELEYA